jgi:hypothetical protein
MSFVTFITPHVTASLCLKQNLYPQKPSVETYLQHTKYIVSYYRQTINYFKVLLLNKYFRANKVCERKCTGLLDDKQAPVLRAADEFCLIQFSEQRLIIPMLLVKQHEGAEFVFQLQ